MAHLLCFHVAAVAWHIVAVLGAMTGTQIRKPAARRLQGKFLHITDFHPDALYRLGADPEYMCHRRHGSSGTYGAEISGCDSPLALINATLDWIAAELKDQIDFVVWTGDSARHDNDNKIPRSRDQVLGSNRWLADKVAEAFSEPTAANGTRLAIPVIPTLGNNDILPHNILQPGPNQWLQDYAQVWRRFIPEQQRHAFQFGGWYYVEAIPDRLAVFSLNTLYFFDRNAAVDDCLQPSEPGFKQFEWLRVQLQFMRQRGIKAILLGHVPPARTRSKQLWDEGCWQKYTLWLQQYRDVVVGSVYGHMNVDHFLVHDASQIRFAQLSATAPSIEHQPLRSRRAAMKDELSMESTADFLQELRKGWSKLPKPKRFAATEAESTTTTSSINDEDRHHYSQTRQSKRSGKKKKIKDLWGERFSVSFVSPSVVPNFYPTVRVFEYNITGLDDHQLWVNSSPTPPCLATEEDEQHHLELRHAPDSIPFHQRVQGAATEYDTAKQLAIGKPKHSKPKFPHPPSETSSPGPAYSSQTFTWLGYTQYFANITTINRAAEPRRRKPNLRPAWLPFWVTPRRPSSGTSLGRSELPDRPGVFAFKIEYATALDTMLNLTDLTVNNMVELAYKIGQRKGNAAGWPFEPRASEPNAAVAGRIRDGDIPSRVHMVGEEPAESTINGGAKERQIQKKQGEVGKEGERMNKPANAIWMHFLDHAFVRTLSPRDLEKLASN